MTTATEQRWETVDVDDAAAARLGAGLGVPPALACLLVGRGYADLDEARRFLDPRLSDMADPFNLPDMAEAVRRVWASIRAGESMVVFGDYDADGISSTALLVRVLRALGGKVEPFLPSRFTDGYGLTVGAFNRCVGLHEPSLIVTVDCGTGSREAVELAQKQCIDVVVTDHHALSGSPAPAVAVVNPQLGTDAPSRWLSGVGVAFKLAHALVKYGLDEGYAAAKTVDVREYLDLVAIGTVADVVPLLGENRILVRHGLDRLNRHLLPGVRALKAVSGLDGRMDCYHLGFVIGPRLNAAGRLGSPQMALDLLLTDDLDEARRLATKLNAANDERKRIEDRIKSEAEQEIECTFDSDTHFGLVVARQGWHVGTIGIVAARLAAQYRRPAVVIGLADGAGRGSGRSIEGVDLVGLLKGCADQLIGFGGHEMAAGLEIETANLESFSERFNEACRAVLTSQDLRPVQCVDAWLDSLDEADSRLLETIDQLRPLGMGNPTPTWGIRGVELLGPARRVGRNRDHLKMTVGLGGSQMPAMAFQMGDREVPDGPLDLAFQLRENTYMGRTSRVLNIRDFRSSEGALRRH